MKPKDLILIILQVAILVIAVAWGIRTTAALNRLETDWSLFRAKQDGAAQIVSLMQYDVGGWDIRPITKKEVADEVFAESQMYMDELTDSTE